MINLQSRFILVYAFQSLHWALLDLQSLDANFRLHPTLLLLLLLHLALLCLHRLESILTKECLHHPWRKLTLECECFCDWMDDESQKCMCWHFLQLTNFQSNPLMLQDSKRWLIRSTNYEDLPQIRIDLMNSLFDRDLHSWKLERASTLHYLALEVSENLILIYH